MNIDKATEVEFTISTQREMLKKCRNILRDKNMGNLYPAQPEDFRKALKTFAKSHESSKNVFFEQLATDERVQVSILLEFVEEQGLLPEQLERFLRKKNG